jgi:hypothetical protein
VEIIPLQEDEYKLEMKKLEETSNDSESKLIDLFSQVLGSMCISFIFVFFIMTKRRLVIALFSTFPGPKDVIIARQKLTQKHNEEIHELERELDKNVRIFCHIQQIAAAS